MSPASRSAQRFQELVRSEFPQIQEGEIVDSIRSAVTEADIVNFAALSGDWTTIHTDAEYAKGMMFGERIAHGALVMTNARVLWNYVYSVNTDTATGAILITTSATTGSGGSGFGASTTLTGVAGAARTSRFGAVAGSDAADSAFEGRVMSCFPPPPNKTNAPIPTTASAPTPRPA